MAVSIAEGLAGALRASETARVRNRAPTPTNASPLGSTQCRS